MNCLDLETELPELLDLANEWDMPDLVNVIAKYPYKQKIEQRDGRKGENDL